ncbi:hypothetical protein V6N13_137333 [Hibiscus sabdariffa]
MTLCLIENGPKCIVNVENKERSGVGLVVEIGDRLKQQLVVEINQGVLSLFALLKGGRSGVCRKTPQWWKRTHRYFPHSQAMYTSQVHSKLADDV